MTGDFFAYYSLCKRWLSTIACVIQYISGINYARYTLKPQINYICWWQRNQNLRFTDDIDFTACYKKYKYSYQSFQIIWDESK